MAQNAADRPTHRATVNTKKLSILEVVETSNKVDNGRVLEKFSFDASGMPGNSSALLKLGGSS